MLNVLEKFNAFFPFLNRMASFEKRKYIHQILHILFSGYPVHSQPARRKTLNKIILINSYALKLLIPHFIQCTDKQTYRIGQDFSVSVGLREVVLQHFISGFEICRVQRITLFPDMLYIIYKFHDGRIFFKNKFVLDFCFFPLKNLPIRIRF